MSDNVGERNDVTGLDIVGVASHTQSQCRLNQMNIIGDTGRRIGHPDYREIRGYNVSNRHASDIGRLISHCGRNINIEHRGTTPIKDDWH